jgi:hypothetical protein
MTPVVQVHRHSGRRFVIGAIVAILAIWGTLYLAFRDWRARHNALADFGRQEVAAAVDPLAEAVPPGVSPAEWREAVADTHRAIAEVMAYGLSRASMVELRDDLALRVARARPETSRDTLSRIWDETAGLAKLREGTRKPKLLAAETPPQPAGAESQGP